MAAKNVSVIIPTYNRAKELAACLNALQPQISAERTVEVLILDDGSASASRELVEAEFGWARWHAGPRQGPAANRNAGAKHALGEWLIFLDDDCIPSERFLSSYVERILGPLLGNVTLLGPTVWAEMPQSLLWEAPHNPVGRSLISANFAIRRAQFLTIGGFDERYQFSFEDMEFADRLHRSNGVVEFVSGAKVVHPLRRLPNARQLANRWEARVISTLDFGATPWQTAWKLPLHILKVIVARYRRQPLSMENVHAGLIFGCEFAFCLLLLPGWLRKHSKGPRSQFWRGEVAKGIAPAGYGL